MKRILATTAASAFVAVMLAAAAPVGAHSTSGCTVHGAGNGSPKTCTFTAASGTVTYQANDPKGSTWFIADNTPHPCGSFTCTTGQQGFSSMSGTIPVVSGDSITLEIAGVGSITASS